MNAPQGGTTRSTSPPSPALPPNNLASPSPSSSKLEATSAFNASNPLHPLLPPPPPNAKADNDDERRWGLPTAHPRDWSPTLEAKLSRFWHLKAEGTHFNASLSSNRAFNNPHIYDKLVRFVRIDETASNFDDMAAWKTCLVDEAERRERNKDRLASEQRAAADRKEEQRKAQQRQSIAFAPSSSASASPSTRSPAASAGGISKRAAMDQVDRWKGKEGLRLGPPAHPSSSSSSSSDRHRHRRDEGKQQQQQQQQQQEKRKGWR
ncbi:uncharacterized protein PFL1_04925 [Pseudozyma flocculosa PF-1]|uniref:Uncharacterized protein n=1 Tax=Pseudozyma flocculosa PF-1 TaxID=1277687 RepID=A0A061H9W9_9BASI|nr:uncharacterized protein PFL1_04925 [Pseudozyma flocculosa PF-1]EPQ27386.1 hypothetical protein PFL1_04925 [Pseudozyma flocculosa PF-1]